MCPRSGLVAWIQQKRNWHFAGGRRRSTVRAIRFRIQMDETALPILLAPILYRHHLILSDRAWPTVRVAAAYLVQNVTQQDRWEKDGGYSPYTLNLRLSTAGAAYQHRAANPTTQTQMRFSGTTVQPLGCRNRLNNGCGIGASFPAVSTWIAGLSQAELISERRPSFPKAIN
jgi:hypothetical protein